jgi:RNA polymerase sigma-70 factor, ECF subfamily
LDVNRPSLVDLAQLAVEHQATVYRAAYRLCGSAVDAEDLTQQTFLAAYRSREQLRDPTAARAWLSAILRSCFLKSLRKRRPATVADDEFDWNGVPGPAPEPTSVDPERLQLALDGLSPESRVMLVLYYFENQSYREIAAALELPLGTVMSRLSRAKEQLRRKMLALEKEQATKTATNGAANSNGAIRRPAKTHG